MNVARAGALGGERVAEHRVLALEVGEDDVVALGGEVGEPLDDERLRRDRVAGDLLDAREDGGDRRGLVAASTNACVRAGGALTLIRHLLHLDRVLDRADVLADPAALAVVEVDHHRSVLAPHRTFRAEERAEAADVAGLEDRGRSTDHEPVWLPARSVTLTAKRRERRPWARPPRARRACRRRRCAGARIARSRRGPRRRSARRSSRPSGPDRLLEELEAVGEEELHRGAEHGDVSHRPPLGGEDPVVPRDCEPGTCATW